MEIQEYIDKDSNGVQQVPLGLFSTFMGASQALNCAPLYYVEKWRRQGQQSVTSVVEMAIMPTVFTLRGCSLRSRL